MSNFQLPTHQKIHPNQHFSIDQKPKSEKIYSRMHLQPSNNLPQKSPAPNKPPKPHFYTPGGKPRKYHYTLQDIANLTGKTKSAIYNAIHRKQINPTSLQSIVNFYNTTL